MPFTFEVDIGWVKHGSAKRTVDGAPGKGRSFAGERQNNCTRRCAYNSVSTWPRAVVLTHSRTPLQIIDKFLQRLVDFTFSLLTLHSSLSKLVDFRTHQKLLILWDEQFP